MSYGMRPPPSRYRIVVAMIVWFGLGMQYAITLRLKLLDGSGPVYGTMFYFSFFSVLTNLLGALALTLPMLMPRLRLGRLFSHASIQTGIAASMIVLSVAYNLWLRHLWQPRGLVWIAGELLHDVAPILFVVFWLWQVPKQTLRLWDPLAWLAYPAFYAAVTLARGAKSWWYPYPFFNARQLGLERTLINVTWLMGAFLAVGLVLLVIGRLQGGSAPRGRRAA